MTKPSRGDWRAETARRRSQATTEGILKAADQLFREAERDGRPASDVTVRRIAERAGKAASTVLHHFKSFETLCAELEIRMRRDGRAVPAAVAAFARSHNDRAQASSIASRNHSTQIEQQLRRTADLDRRQSLRKQIDQEASPALRARADLAVAESLLEDHQLQDALGAAEEAVELAGKYPRDTEFLEIGLRASRCGAEAARLLARNPEVRDKYLGQVHRYKVIESEHAKSLRYPVVETFARFHAERAMALISQRPRDEVRSIYNTAMRIRQHHADQIPIPPTSMTTFLARLVAALVAYADLEEVKDEIEALTQDLDELLKVYGLREQEERTAIEALASLALDPDYTDCPTPGLLLRISQFGSIGQYLCGRHLLTRAKRANLQHRPAAEPDFVLDRELTADEFRIGAVNFLRQSQNETLDIGSAGVIKQRARDLLATLDVPLSHHTENYQHDTVESLLESIDRVVLRVLVSTPSPLRTVDAGRVLRAIRPIYDYLLYNPSAQQRHESVSEPLEHQPR